MEKQKIICGKCKLLKYGEYYCDNCCKEYCYDCGKNFNWWYGGNSWEECKTKDCVTLIF